MRKILFFAAVSSLCVLQFGSGAIAATRVNVRGANETAPAQPVANTARAATRGAVKTNNAAINTQQTTARAATKQTAAPKSNVVAARAGATQKVINTGTKVATATENTTVPQECQDAFYGCMDAFCMLDNASGGRCQCSDRIIELDKALDDILKLDEQTYIMATEGVDRIQMGEAEEQIMTRAKAAAEKVSSSEKSESNKLKARTLDLSLWNNNIFDEDADLFDSFGSGTDNDLTDKKGDALYKASMKICAGQIPDKCKSYGSMLQLVYAQKIKSDCIAYENSLKAQKSQSQQKLQTAQKALRDAALEEYRNQNKYATTGECVVAFTQCMQTTAECGDDYTGCVTLAAAENVRTDKSGVVAAQTTIKGAVKGADITLAASTMDQLLTKKTICEHITKQCVNSNKNDAVWNAFLHNAAPALKSAELVAEQNLRSNCIPTIAKCFQNSCKSNFVDDDSYDICLSNPLTYKTLCKVELEPCLMATGGTFDDPEKSTLWNGVLAMLNAMKVDVCTSQIKTCLTERCGDDFAGCIGLSTQSIVNLCPRQTLTACMDKDYDVETVDEYIAEIASGLMIQIDNNLLYTCKNAVNEAMVRVCGDTESCDVVKSENLGTDLLNFSNGQITGTINWNLVTKTLTKFAYNGITEEITVAQPLNDVVDRVMASIESDPKVQYCMTGRKVPGFTGFKNNTAVGGDIDDSNSTRFANLTNSIRDVIMDQVLNTAIENYDNKLADLKVEEAIYNAAQSDTNAGDIKCKAYQQAGDFSQRANHKETTVRTTSYDQSSRICTVTTEKYVCKKYNSSGSHKGCSMDSGGSNCAGNAPGSWCRESTQSVTYQM